MFKSILTALALLTLFSAPALATAATPGRVEFDIIMNGKPVGRHVVQVTPSPDGVVATVGISMAGRVGPFGFTYEHRCTERWIGEVLASLECRDRENKKVQTVRANTTNEGLAIAGTAFSGPAPATVRPTSWWRPFKSGTTRVVDTRTGALANFTVKPVGAETITTAEGPIQAQRYRVQGSTRADVWYDTQGRWVKMAFRLRGQSFEYRKRSPVASAPQG